MKRLSLILYLTGNSLLCFSQVNLVLNPSFENYTICPSGLGQVNNCNSWFNPTNGTPDYFNSCAPSILQCSVPLNFWGFQFARTGVAYCGVGVKSFGFTVGREYIETRLSDSLINNKKYCVSFYVSLSDSSAWATDRVGAYLSADSINGIGQGVLGYAPQVENPVGNIIRDTSNWILISGIYTAIGGEKYITIGNFYDNANTNIDSMGQSIQDASYYYIDDVSVIEMIYDSANAGMDTTICEGDSIVIGTAPCNSCAYSWQPATGLSDATLAQPFAFPTQTTAYILTLTDTTANSIDTCVCRGSQTTTDTVTIYVLTSPNNANAGGDVTLCKGESISLGAASCSGCTYLWQPSTWLNDATIAQPTATPLQTTIYILVMTDSFPPCVKTTSDNVTVFVEDCTVEVFNIFTPNGDTKNDFFFIKNLPANSTLQIFNRWGSRIFESSNYDNQWDGDKVPDGTYYYILATQDKKSYHGFVEIRR